MKDGADDSTAKAMLIEFHDGWLMEHVCGRSRRRFPFDVSRNVIAENIQTSIHVFTNESNTSAPLLPWPVVQPGPYLTSPTLPSSRRGSVTDGMPAPSAVTTTTLQDARRAADPHHTTPYEPTAEPRRPAALMHPALPVLHAPQPAGPGRYVSRQGHLVVGRQKTRPTRLE